MLKVPKGFIPLIEYEQKYNDKLLIMFPSKYYRKDNILFYTTTNSYKEITNVKICPLTGYRIPELKEIEYVEST